MHTTTRSQRHELHLAVIAARENLRAAIAAYHAVKRTGPISTRVEYLPLVEATARRTSAIEALSHAQRAYRTASLRVFGTTENAETVCHYLHIEGIECELSAPPPGPAEVVLAGENGRRSTVSGVRAACSAKTFSRIVAEVEAARLEQREQCAANQ